MAQGIAEENITCLGTDLARRPPRRPSTISIFRSTRSRKTAASAPGNRSTRGVPVVAKLGNGASSRAGGSIVAAVGLGDWVAEDDEGYVEIARKFATQPDHLAKLRAELPAQIAASPAGNVEIYTRELEAGYRKFWRDYCAAASESGDAPAQGDVPSGSVQPRQPVHSGRISGRPARRESVRTRPRAIFRRDTLQSSAGRARIPECAIAEEVEEAGGRAIVSLRRAPMARADMRRPMRSAARSCRLFRIISTPRTCSACAAQQGGRLEEAQQLLERAIAIDPRSHEAHSNLAAVYFGLQKLEAARACQEKAIALKPNFTPALTGLGNTLLQHETCPNRPSRLYDRAIRLKPDYADALCNRGVAELALLRFDRARAEL